MSKTTSNKILRAELCNYLRYGKILKLIVFFRFMKIKTTLKKTKY